MTVKLNQPAFDLAKKLIEQGKCVFDEKDQWSEHHPSTEEENAYLQTHSVEEYGKWYLGVDTDEAEGNKGRYKFPYSDFHNVHRCGVISAESRAGQYKYADIERAAAHLHGMLETVKK